MAWTTSKVAQYGIGNVVIQHWTLVADSATLELATGLGTLLSAQSSIKSATTAGFKTKINVTSLGTASYGAVAITGVASGDELYLTVIGN
jgi:hypothetical protein